MAVLKSISLADQVFEKLESDIISGVYPRGEVLTELKLVEQLNVSRTPIREALRRLEQERLIRDSGKGSVVLGITLEDLEDIMDIRLRCEGLAAYYAAKNRTPEDARRLRQLIEGLPARERKLILLRYGLAGQPPLTQLETAKLLQISRSYVSRLETHALELLREGWGGCR